MKLRDIRSPFFQGMLKSSFCGWLLGRSPSGRAFRYKSSQGCGLSAAIPNVGERGFTFWIHFTEYGLFPHSVRYRPPRQAAWPKPDIGRKDKRNTSVRAARKSSPAFVRQPKPDRAPIYFSRPYLLALGNGRSRLSGRLLLPAPGK